LIDRCRRMFGSGPGGYRVERDPREAAAARERQAAMVKELRNAELLRDRLEALNLLVKTYPEGHDPRVLLGGRERTAAEYDTLFRPAGFKLARIVPTPPGPSVVEAAPV
jgi:hypothetical protein